jgi:hypothetical protein
LFSLPLWPFPRTLLDWKSIDEINAFAVHFPEYAEAFAGFYWDGEGEGEDISQGFAAASQWLHRNELQLIDIETGGDCYDLAIIPAHNVPRFQTLVAELGIAATVMTQ